MLCKVTSPGLANPVSLVLLNTVKAASLFICMQQHQLWAVPCNKLTSWGLQFLPQPQLSCVCQLFIPVLPQSGPALELWWEEALSTVVREAQLTLIKLMLISSQQTHTWAQSQYKDENSRVWKC